MGIEENLGVYEYLFEYLIFKYIITRNSCQSSANE